MGMKKMRTILKRKTQMEKRMRKALEALMMMRKTLKTKAPGTMRTQKMKAHGTMRTMRMKDQRKKRVLKKKNQKKTRALRMRTMNSKDSVKWSSTEGKAETQDHEHLALTLSNYINFYSKTTFKFQ